MISKPQALKIARVVAGLCVSAGLIYFVYSKNSPFVVTVVIGLAVVSFSIFSKRPATLLRNPYITAIASVGSRKPLRDLARAVVCFAAMMAFTIGMAIGVKHKVIPDNNLIAGNLVCADDRRSCCSSGVSLSRSDSYYVRTAPRLIVERKV